MGLSAPCASPGEPHAFALFVQSQKIQPPQQDASPKFALPVIREAG